MALVRPKPSAIAEPVSMPALAPSPALPRPALPLLSPVPSNGGYLRRCTFRKMTLARPTARHGDLEYVVTCLYPDHTTGAPLGDLASARAICDGCAATGIFRPDED